MATKGSTESVLRIEPLKQGRTTMRIIGTTGFYFNAMSNKVKGQLLIGSGKKTAAEKKQIKHDPENEFRDSMYLAKDGPTYLAFPAPGVKAAMATAALETEGIKKTEVQRLTFLPQERISIWGLPYLRMDVVRSADMNKTPDVRTRAFLPRWCASVDIAFVSPALSTASIAALLANAGIVCGLGDFRQEKGKGSSGCFALLDDQNEEMMAVWNELVKNEGREAQMKAAQNPEAYDDDTRNLWALLRQERMRRAA